MYSPDLLLRFNMLIIDFIEIKAVTYCGKSDASSLTMQNVPWHKDVCAYGEEICDAINVRGLAASRCVVVVRIYMSILCAAAAYYTDVWITVNYCFATGAETRVCALTSFPPPLFCVRAMYVRLQVSAVLLF
jgi:hypothetical protein